MAKLFGAQRLVLKAIQDLSKNDADYITDAQVAQSTSIALKDVRDWFQTLADDGYVEVAPTETGNRACITPAGRLTLRGTQGSAEDDRLLNVSRSATEHFLKGDPQNVETQNLRSSAQQILTSNDYTVVLGRFKNPTGIEALIGYGDAMAASELKLLLLLQDRPYQCSTTWSDMLGDRSDSNLVLLGGSHPNTTTSEFLSLSQSNIAYKKRKNKNMGDFWYGTSVYDTKAHPAIRHAPKYTKDGQWVITDFGVIIKAKNPWNPRNNIICIFGCYGFGTWAGVRLLSNPGLLSYNETKLPSFECLFKISVRNDHPREAEILFVRGISQEIP